MAVRQLADNAQLRRDPTQTTVLRNEYSADVFTRFRGLKGLVRTTVVDNDALRIGRRFQRSGRGPMAAIAVPVRDFGEVLDRFKVQAFMQWLGDAADEDVLAVQEREGRTVVARQAWQNTYVRRAYGAGIEHADTELRRAGLTVPDEPLGVAFNKPIHADRLGVLFLQNFEDLDNITTEMAAQIRRRLASGLARGIGPAPMAADLNDRIDAIGITRGRTLARTAVIRAHAEATLNRFQEFGIQEVGALAEWATAGDNRVCPICRGNEGTVWKLNEARGLIPAHPNCRCTWLPVVRERDANVTRLPGDEPNITAFPEG